MIMGAGLSGVPRREGLRATKTIVVSWGHCDATGVVYYPRYYELFDTCTRAMLQAAGLGQRRLARDYGSAGLSLVEAKANFRASATHEDVLEVHSRVIAVGGSSVTVSHEVRRGEQIVVEGHEVRVWAGQSPCGRLEADSIPPEVRAVLLGASRSHC